DTDRGERDPLAANVAQRLLKPVGLTLHAVDEHAQHILTANPSVLEEMTGWSVASFAGIGGREDLGTGPFGGLEAAAPPQRSIVSYESLEPFESQSHRWILHRSDLRHLPPGGAAHEQGHGLADVTKRWRTVVSGPVTRGYPLLNSDPCVNHTTPIGD